MMLEIIPKDEILETLRVRDQLILIEKKLTYGEAKYGVIVFTEEESFFHKFSLAEKDIIIIDKANKHKFKSALIKTNNGGCRIGNLKELMEKHYVKVGDIAKLYIDIDNQQISVEFVNMEIKTLTYIESRNQVIVALNLKLLKNAGFEPGSRVNIIYSKDKIIIEKLEKEEKIEDDFGLVPPAEFVDPYVQNVAGLLSAFEKKFTDGVLEFRLQTLMHKFKEDEKSYIAFLSKQKIVIDKINRNMLYPEYIYECGVNTKTWTFWYKRLPRQNKNIEECWTT